MKQKPKTVLEMAFDNAITYACAPDTAGGVLMAALSRYNGESPWCSVIFFLMRERPL